MAPTIGSDDGVIAVIVATIWKSKCAKRRRTLKFNGSEIAQSQSHIHIENGKRCAYSDQTIFFLVHLWLVLMGMQWNSKQPGEGKWAAFWEGLFQMTTPSVSSILLFSLITNETFFTELPLLGFSLSLLSNYSTLSGQLRWFCLPYHVVIFPSTKQQQPEIDWNLQKLIQM